MAFHPWKLKGLDLNQNFASEWGEFCLCVCVCVCVQCAPCFGPHACFRKGAERKRGLWDDSGLEWGREFRHNRGGINAGSLAYRVGSGALALGALGLVAVVSHVSVSVPV